MLQLGIPEQHLLLIYINNNTLSIVSSNPESVQQVKQGLVLQKVADYKLLVKLRLSLTVVFSSVLAYLIALPAGSINWQGAALLALGGFLVTGAANALNQVLEKDYDRLMKRTANRPLATGRMSVSEAVLFAGFMSLVGIVILALFNPWASFFGTLALVLYAFVYTPMKRIGPVAVFVGAIPGAIPVLIGAVAADARLSVLGLILFGVQFFWQFPHFWAIGWLGHEDYSKAGYKLFPSVNGEPDSSAGMQSFVYALLLMPLCFGLYAMGLGSLIAAVIALVLTLGYAVFSWNFYRQANRKSALLLMFYSFGYLPLVLLTFFIDKIFI